MNDIQKQDVVAYRKLQGLPLHAPPHFEDGVKTYLLSASNYEHKHIMASEARRMDFQDKLTGRLSAIEGAFLFAWSILSNHYHVLIMSDLNSIRKALAKLHNGIATQWNREDNCPGRKVWHRFSDRHIRSDEHYWASVNYIHRNPVKHGLTVEPNEWKTSSFNIFQEMVGKEKMSLILQNFPVDRMGNGWDD